MVSSYSTIIVGLGIFSVWALTYATIFLGIYSGLEGFPTQDEMNELRASRNSMEKFFSNDINPLTTYFMLWLSEAGIIFGSIVVICGALIWAYEQATKKSHSPKKKKVSIFWQIVCSFIPGFDLWAVYRIKKLWFGVIVWAISYGTGFAELYGMIPEFGDPIIVSLILIIMYAGFVFKWSRDWNKMLSGEKVSEQDKALFTG